MACRQFDEQPDVVPFARVAADRVAIGDVIRKLPSLRPALDLFLLQGKVRTRAREIFQRFAWWARDNGRTDRISTRGNRGGQNVSMSTEA